MWLPQCNAQDLNKLFLPNAAEDVPLEADNVMKISDIERSLHAIEEDEAEALELEAALTLHYDHKEVMAGLVLVCHRVQCACVS